MKKIRLLKDELEYIILNYIVSNIPIWEIRKRIYKILGMKIGKGSRILMKTVVTSPKNIEIGENSYVNEFVFLDGRGGLKIGNNVSIAIHSKILTASHNVFDKEFGYVKKSVTIGDYVAVFTGSIICPGAKIREGCVFSAGSVVKKNDYDAYGVWGGNPVSFICKRDSKIQYVLDNWKPYLR